MARAGEAQGASPDRALTDAFCRNVQEAGRYGDGNGLYLLVVPSGARRWIQRLVVRGRARKLGLGSFNTVSLAEARELALANRKLVREGGDPRSAGRHRTAGVPTFEEAAYKVLTIHKGGWRKGGKTASQWESSLRDHAFPELGGKTVDRVTTADMMAVLLPLWTSKYVTARKVLHRSSAVMKWAMAQGYRTDNPEGDALLAALPKRPTPVQHRRALSCQQPSRTDGFSTLVGAGPGTDLFVLILMKMKISAVGAVGNRVLRGFPSSLGARSLRPWGAAASTAPALAAGTAFG